MTVSIGDDAHPHALRGVAVERDDEPLAWTITYYAHADGTVYGQADDGAIGYQYTDDMDIDDVVRFMSDTLEAPESFGGLYFGTHPIRHAAPDPEGQPAP